MLFVVPRPTLRLCQGLVLGEHRGLGGGMGRFGLFHFSLSQGQRAGCGAPCRARLGADLRGRFLQQLVGQVGVILKFCSEGFEVSHTFLGEGREESTEQLLTEVATGNSNIHSVFREKQAAHSALVTKDMLILVKI